MTISENCPNCGAPKSGYKCAYCGTVFEERKWGENEEVLYAFDEPVAVAKTTYYGYTDTDGAYHACGELVYNPLR